MYAKRVIRPSAISPWDAHDRHPRGSAAPGSIMSNRASPTVFASKLEQRQNGLQPSLAGPSCSTGGLAKATPGTSGLPIRSSRRHLRIMQIVALQTNGENIWQKVASRSRDTYFPE